MKQKQKNEEKKKKEKIKQNGEESGKKGMKKNCLCTVKGYLLEIRKVSPKPYCIY